MPVDEEEKKEEKLKDKRDEKKPEEEPKEKNKTLLWWGLGIGAAALVATLFLYNNNANNAANQQQQQQPPTNYNPATDPNSMYSAAGNEYWPLPNGSNSQTGGLPGSSPAGPGGGTQNNSSGGTTSGNVPANTPGYSHASGKWGKNGAGYTGGSSSTSGGNTSSNNNNNSNNNSSGAVGPAPQGTSGMTNNFWVYTTKSGDTLNSITNMAGWDSAHQSGGGPGFLINYRNNSQVLSSRGINTSNPNAKLPSGIQLSL
jgi:cytoskeletal protein RodZ